MRVIVGNRYSRLDGDLGNSTIAPYDFYRILDKLLSTKVPGYYFSTKYKAGIWDGRKHFYNPDKKMFPTGFLAMVLKLLKEYNVDTVVLDNRTKKLDMVELSLKNIELRPYQKEAVNKLVKIRFGIVHHPTGSGKTVIILALFNLFRNYRCLYITNRLDLLLQTRKRMIEVGFNPEDIGIVGGGEKEVKQFTLATCQSLWSLRKTSLFGEIATSTDVMCVDEVHILPAETYYKVAMKIDAGYRFGFSGTPLVDDDFRNKHVIAATGPVLSKVSASLLIEKDLLAEPKILFIKSESPKYECLLDETYSEIYDSAIVDNEWRNNAIEQIVRTAVDNGLNVLVLVKRIPHGEILSERLNIPFVSGRDSSEKRSEYIEKLEKGKIKALISSTIFDEGIDIKNINVLVIAAAGKSYAKIIQRIGRGMRVREGKSSIYVVDFDDIHNKYTKKHSAKRIKICRETYEGNVNVLPLQEVINEISGLGKFNSEIYKN